MTRSDSSRFAPLSVSAIRKAMSEDSYNQLSELLVFDSVTSTNDRLWQRVEEGLTEPAVCISEHQTAGRGRRGDKWQSPPAGNLYLSLLWPFPADRIANGLSLAIGVCLINTLKAQGISGLQLKWPNDVLFEQQKLAGILVESRFGQRYNTVVGVGLNFKLPTATQLQIQQPTTSLQQLCTQVPCRNELAGQLIQNMIETTSLFQARGLQDFVPLWPRYDALHNKAIHLIDGDTQTLVKARGINEAGELRYEHQNQLHTLSNSHVRIRIAS